MYMTASLGWPCEKTTFPFEYVAMRRVAPADLRKASASKAGPFSRSSTRRGFALGIGSRANYLTRRLAARRARQPLRARREERVARPHRDDGPRGVPSAELEARL